MQAEAAAFAALDPEAAATQMPKMQVGTLLLWVVELWRCWSHGASKGKGQGRCCHKHNTHNNSPSATAPVTGPHAVCRQHGAGGGGGHAAPRFGRPKHAVWAACSA